MIGRLLSYLTFPLAAVVLALFAIANRGFVVVSFDPVPFTVELPLYAVAFCAIFVGLLLGYAVSWLSHAPARREARRLRRSLATAQADVLSLRADAAKSTSPGSTAVARDTP